MAPRLRSVLAACGAFVALAACAGDPEASSYTPRPTTDAAVGFPSRNTVSADGAPVRLGVEVLARYRHDPESFTQGLVFDDSGGLFETTGHYRRSSVRKVDIPTGESLRQRALDKEVFGEGIALVDDRLIVLTWRENEALVMRASDFEEVDRIPYDGEGWGLCYDGADLVMSDGSADLVFRDPNDFQERRRITVTESGAPVPRLNELECVGGRIFANQWMTDRILEIDSTSGQVTAVVNAAGLLSDEEAEEADVLNGIAYDENSGTFLITGKNWPWMFEVRFSE